MVEYNAVTIFVNIEIKSDPEDTVLLCLFLH